MFCLDYVDAFLEGKWAFHIFKNFILTSKGLLETSDAKNTFHPTKVNVDIWECDLMFRLDCVDASLEDELCQGENLESNAFVNST